MPPTRKHSILLLNFAEQDAAIIRRAGFNVELGYAGALKYFGGDRTCPLFPYFFPRPLYEYEVLVYSSAHTKKEELFKSSIKTAQLFGNAEEPMLVPLFALAAPPAIRIAFIGVPWGSEKLVPSNVLLPAGLPYMELLRAHEGVSEFETYSGPDRFGNPDLADLIASFRRDIALPVGQYARRLTSVDCPFRHHPVIVNRVGDQVASYGTMFERSAEPVYVVLPQLKNNALAVVKLLGELARLRPELFPDREIRDWYNGPEFAFAEERDIEREIAARLEEVNQFCQRKKQEKADVAARFAFMKRILVAREDPALPLDERLSTNVRRTLEFLGFAVEDIDAKIRGAIKKEDFWVKDGQDFLAITEVTGTNAKNPKAKEFNDLFARMATIFKRRELVPDASSISGLPIVNHDIDTNPRLRPKLYTGDAEEIAATAKERCIGLLSAVELYNVSLAVKDGVITKEQARALIKEPGRIEFNSRVANGDALK